MCFLHIPKSGGVSIHTALEAALAPGSLAPWRFDTSTFCDFKDFELLNPAGRALVAATMEEVQSLGSYRVVSGHFSLTTLLQVAPASSIATVLREPRTRLLSLYTYWRTRDVGRNLMPYRANLHAQRPLPSFLAERLLAPAVDNQVCRMLLQGDPRLPESDFIASSDVEGIAADAIDRLDALGFVGVLELGDSAWRGVSRLFEVKLDPVELNVTGELENLDAVPTGEALFTADALDLIERHSAADAVVYDHALALAGLDKRERSRLANGTFARQLVRMGDLIGPSAARAAAQAELAKTLRAQVLERDGWGEELQATRERLQIADGHLEELHARLEETHRALLEAHERLGEERERLVMHERTIQGLREELDRRTAEADGLRRWLEAVHASASWRLTTPLRAAKHGLERLR
jgi:hypothetical protein